MTTTNALTSAIQESIDRTETIVVHIGSEEDVNDVAAALYASPLCEDYDSTEITPTLLDVWGTTEAGDEWRLHLMQTERAGAARYHE